MLLCFVGRCSLLLPPFPPFSSIPKPILQRQAPSPQLWVGIYPHPTPRGGTHAGTPSHQLSGTDRKKPHEMDVDLSVPQKCHAG